MELHHAVAGKTYPSLEALAVQCGVHARTVKRDLRVLRDEFGAPLAYSRTHGGYYYQHEFNLAAPTFSEGELLALCLSTSLAQSLQHTSLAPAMRRALSKLQVMLPLPVQEAMDGPWLSCLPEPTPPERVETAIHFNDLLHALEGHRQVLLVYYTMSRDAVSTRIIDPYHLYFRRGMWYLHAWCHLRNTTRDFALERIRSLARLDTTFPPPDTDAIRARLGRRFSLMHEGRLVEVVIRFDAEWARRVQERVWHATQQIEGHSDGSCTLTMTVDGLSSVVRWVLGFGRHAVPLAPPELVRMVAEEVRAMMAQHA